jgi:ABC-type Mn2+/Zn2+ transport system ATPase subunit
MAEDEAEALVLDDEELELSEPQAAIDATSAAAIAQVIAALQMMG